MARECRLRCTNSRSASREPVVHAQRRRTATRVMLRVASTRSWSLGALRTMRLDRMVAERIRRLGRGGGSIPRRARGGERGEVQTLREMVAILREQLQEKEAELEARRDEMRQMLLLHEREVRQLHVVLLQHGQERALLAAAAPALPEPPSTA